MRTFEYRPSSDVVDMVRGTLWTPRRTMTSLTMLRVDLIDGTAVTARWEPGVDLVRPFCVCIQIAEGRFVKKERCADVYDAMELIASTVRRYYIPATPESGAFNWLEIPWCA